MVIKKLSDTTYAFTFTEIADYNTSCFLLIKKYRNYLIDTYCGSGFMHMIKAWIKSSGFEKELIVINSHYHWDHIWGNCLFHKNRIISHSICKRRMADEWDKQFDKNSKYILGDAKMTLPNKTFEDNIVFEDDDIEIFYSPGHTNDSITLYDRESRFLFVGDNLEKPIIYLQSKNIDQYISTLKKYIDMNCSQIYSSHSLKHSNSDVLLTIEYLEKLKMGVNQEFDSEYEKRIHKQNLAYL